MCNGERVRKLCTVTHRGTTNVIVPGVTTTICGTCQCIINFFSLLQSLSLNLSHPHTFSLSIFLYKHVWVYTLSQNTFQPHGPRVIVPEVYSIIIFFHANRIVLLFHLLHYPPNLSGRTPFPLVDHRDY